MKFLLIAVYLNLYLALNPINEQIKNLASQHNAVAAWVFDTTDEIFQNGDPNFGFKSLIGGFTLKTGGWNFLKTWAENTDNMRIPYVDFSLTNNEYQPTILYSDDDGLDLNSSFTIVVVYKKHNSKGFDNGGFLAGKWEECDRSRSYALFGDLPFFGRPNQIVAHISNTGFASPTDCRYAEEAEFSPPDDDPTNYSKWHTVAMVWNATTAAPASIENLNKCQDFTETFKGGDSTTSSTLQSFLDGRPGNVGYYKYRQVYQGTGSYSDHPGQECSLSRKALFTVGGTAARHWKQPDDGELKVSKRTLKGRTFEESKKNTSDEVWSNTFITKCDDYYVRSRFKGLISAVFVLAKPLNVTELQSFNVNNLFKLKTQARRNKRKMKKSKK